MTRPRPNDLPCAYWEVPAPPPPPQQPPPPPPPQPLPPADFTPAATPVADEQGDASQPIKERLLALRTLLGEGLVRRPHAPSPTHPPFHPQLALSRGATPRLKHAPTTPPPSPSPQVSETEYEETRRQILGALI